jgi:predicted DNA-binding transcriptional regulator YafY
MDVEKFYKLHELLRNRRTVSPMVEIMSCLDCSESTAKRTIKFMRSNLDAPIEYDRQYQGYRYSKDSYELPGLWFSAEELLALVTLQKLLTELGSGLLDQQLSPLKPRIQKLLASKHLSLNAMQRIRLLPIAARIPDSVLFQTVAGAVLNQLRLEIQYHTRGSDTEAIRTISPQRLAHYRDNWYLDAWCHQRNALRSFALDRIRQAKVLDKPAQDVSEETLDAHYAAGYGIFAGVAQHLAILRFTPARARWVADERWHPQQQGEWLADGAFQLQIPYADHRELIMDIMRHLPEVEVIAPNELKQEMTERLQTALKIHQTG